MTYMTNLFLMIALMFSVALAVTSYIRKNPPLHIDGKTSRFTIQKTIESQELMYNMTIFAWANYVTVTNWSFRLRKQREASANKRDYRYKIYTSQELIGQGVTDWMMVMVFLHITTPAIIYEKNYPKSPGWFT